MPQSDNPHYETMAELFREDSAHAVYRLNCMLENGEQTNCSSLSAK
jgi:hypothetical protein